MVTALWIAFWLVVAVALWREHTRPVVPVAATKEPHPIARLFHFKPDVPEARPLAKGTLPRRIGSWRLQRRELERAHNSKQKHLDALVNASPKEPSHAATR